MEQPTNPTLERLTAILLHADLDVQVRVERQDPDEIALAIDGPDARLLAGMQGQVLDSLQYLLVSMGNRDHDTRMRISLDADGVRKRRIAKLTEFAATLADEVLSSGQEACTDPLTPYERRIIHTALIERKDVRTYSEGEEPNRYVVISPVVE